MGRKNKKVKSAKIIPRDIFSDRRCFRDRRDSENLDSAPRAGCRRQDQRRQASKFHQGAWWLHADYVDYEEQL